MHRFKYIYGPVLSRRLGRSLGVDLLPFKTCTYDCIYCLLGRTTCHTTELAEYVPVRDVLDELARKLEECTADAVSFAGSGEPTLHSGLGEILDGVKKLTPVKTVVFTNSSLLWHPEVRRRLSRADIISPSLDAALPGTGERINRLAPGLTYDMIYGGLQQFCREYKGRIWLEILFAAGVNDTDEDVEALAQAVRGLDNIECVQLNTVVRPPADKQTAALNGAALERIAAALPGKVEIIAPVFDSESDKRGTKKVSPEEVADLVERHPSTLEGVADGLDCDLNDAREIIRRLVAEGVIAEEDRDGKAFYLVPHPQPQNGPVTGSKS